jgi:hypothetical protein
MASFANSARKLKHDLRKSSVVFDSVLSEETVNELCHAIGHVHRHSFWRPIVTILTFLRQVLLTDCSCRQTVAFTRAESRGATGSAARNGQPSGEPSAYSQARQRLPLGLFQGVSDHLLGQLRDPDRRWRGHRVRVVDGTGVSMPDTPELQAVFPQSGSQKKGCGFPTARLVALFCWASGALLQLKYDSLKVGELNLVRRMLDQIESGDVIVADRLFGTYTELALLRQRQAHGVLRVNAARRIDLRRGRRLGCNDRRMVWHRPQQRPKGLSDELWANLPETLEVRVVRTHVTGRKGFRSHRLDLVTTLLDPQAYPADALAQLYHGRWLAELSFRSLKITLGMDVLRCKSIEMVQKEIVMFQIAYNLIRLLMGKAARLHDLDPHQLSFAGTQQRLLAILPHLGTAHSASAKRRLVNDLVNDIAHDPLPSRPNRTEPRALKRRHKVFPYLTHPRHEARTMAYYAGR